MDNRDDKPEVQSPSRTLKLKSPRTTRAPSQTNNSVQTNNSAIERPSTVMTRADALKVQMQADMDALYANKAKVSR